jgi:DNA-binding transcriptional ArsR family regulator
MKITKNTKYDCFNSETRVKLIICLEKEKSVTELLSMCHLSQSALSQHLKILKDANILDCNRDGQKQIYQVKNIKVLEIAKLLLKL